MWILYYFTDTNSINIIKVELWTMKFVLFCINRSPVSLSAFQHFKICINLVYITGKKVARWAPAVMVMRFQVLSTHQEMIPATKATDAHAQDSEVNEGLLLSILKAFSHRTRSLLNTLSAWYFQSVNIRTASRAHQQQSSSPPPRRQQRSCNHLIVCCLY